MGRCQLGRAMLRRAAVAGLLAILPWLSVLPAAIAGEGSTAPGLAALSVEDLMNVQVTIASKKTQRLFDVPAAVTVLTQEDICRSGMTSIPEVLRLVPGVQVARIDGNKWSITARGDAGRFANKLLVLIDGRTVYTPTFGGVWWDVQDYPLEDIERIEVIRGPGASVWGVNAVNGVINIITKDASDTQGHLAVAGTGNVERSLATYRYGWQGGGGSHYRAYMKRSEYDDLRMASGAPGADAWRLGQAGFRLDRESTGGGFMLQGNAYEGRAGTTEAFPILEAPFTRIGQYHEPMSGLHLLARWETAPAEEGPERLWQVYYDRSYRKDPVAAERRDTLDLEYRDRRSFGTQHDVVWGLGFRYSSHRTDGTDVVWYTPEDRQDSIYNVFLQDEVAVRRNLSLTLGTKLEHNRDTGLEIQPTGRLRWKPTEGETVWAAISRSVRAPSRTDVDINYNYLVAGVHPIFGVPIMARIMGSDTFKSEVVMAYELGYRFQPSERLSLDLSGYYHRGNRFTSYELGDLYPDPAGLYLVAPVTEDNKLNLSLTGLEASGQWQASGRWRLAFSYGLMNAAYSLDPGSTYPTGYDVTEPRHQIHVRSSLNLASNLELDTALFTVSHLPRPYIPAYTRLDIRLGWRPRQGLEASLGVQNLLHDGDQEFGTSLHEQPAQVATSVYGRLAWRF